MTKALYQSFEDQSDPDQGPERLRLLRHEIAARGLSGYLVPRTDGHQGEYVAARDERLAWLTGFTGSAGFCAVLPTCAGVFVDGRYRVQVKTQVRDVFTPVDWPEVKVPNWLRGLADGNGYRSRVDLWSLLHQRSGQSPHAPRGSADHAD